MPEAPSYRVLARKYRPTTLAALVGQDVLVRTLTNAFSSGRIAHAFLLTGVRGVGKTTTARIIARALNCTGPDGKGGPTVTPCGVCDNCKSIADDRAVDVLEMDAATHTGVDDIRALTEGARYAPVAARTKVYILDEVHMLSKAAFNALLKTLEEPPPHITFVFATTEARKLPLTILSRCQRFDLRRVEPDLMAQHLTNISAKEKVTLEAEAAAMLGRAADGSVRDGLSLLDQAMALATDNTVTAALVQEMLGLADRGATLDLLDALFAGNVAGALANLRGQYDRGADPVLVLQDLLDLVHWLTRLKAVPNITERNARTAAEQERGRAVAAKVSMPTLARTWSMLLKGLEEAGQAPDPMAAIEMVLVRLAYVAEMPSPAEVVEKLTQRTSAEMMARPVRSAAVPLPKVTIRDPRANLDPRDHPKPNRPPLAPITTTRPNISPPPLATPAVPDFDTLVTQAGVRGEPKLRAELISGVHLISFAPGAIEFRLGAHASKDLPGRLQRWLNAWTGLSWSVVTAKEGGAPTLAERDTARKAQRVAEAKQDPAVQAVLAAFPGAEIREVRDVAKAPEPPPTDDIPPPGDEDIF